MAQIEITPLNVNGVKVPFNFLDNLLGQQIDYSNLVYPMDLATNPQYCHAIQFSVYDYTYPVIEDFFTKASAAGFSGITNALGELSNLPGQISATQVGPFSVNSVATDVANAGKDAANKAISVAKETTLNNLKGMLSGAMNADLSSFVNNPLSAIGGFAGKAPAEMEQLFSKYGPLITPGSYKRQIEKQKLASISLYMPDSLITNFSSEYNSTSMTGAFGLVGYMGNAISDLLKDKDSKEGNLANVLNNYGRGGAAYVGGKIFGAMGGNAQDAELALGNALKRVPNPQIQLLYKGINLREFQFEFTFTPATSKEAEEVDQIIKTFTYYSLPDITSGTGGQYFIPPQVFRIKFAFLGNDGAAGQIYDVFKNSVGNLLGNQITKIVSGSNPTNDITNAKTAKIFNINDCVLKDIEVNYAPNGWASYTDGYPVQTTLRLTFGEIELINKTSDGVAPRNTSNYNKGDGLAAATNDYNNLKYMV